MGQNLNFRKHMRFSSITSFPSSLGTDSALKQCLLLLLRDSNRHTVAQKSLTLEELDVQQLSFLQQPYLEHKLQLNWRSNFTPIHKSILLLH